MRFILPRGTDMLRILTVGIMGLMFSMGNVYEISSNLSCATANFHYRRE